MRLLFCFFGLFCAVRKFQVKAKNNKEAKRCFLCSLWVFISISFVPWSSIVVQKTNNKTSVSHAFLWRMKFSSIAVNTHWSSSSAPLTCTVLILRTKKVNLEEPGSGLSDVDGVFALGLSVEVVSYKTHRTSLSWLKSKRSCLSRWCWPADVAGWKKKAWLLLPAPGL